MKKSLNHLLKFFIVTSFIIWFITVYALGFPNFTPGWETVWSDMSSKITNIKSDCSVWKYIQWFWANWTPICKNKSSFSLLAISGSNSNYTMIWNWLYTKYLWKILNDCWNWKYIKWFDSSKNMLCVTKNWSISTIWTSINLTPSVIHNFPSSTPNSEQAWWLYTTSYFDKIFVDCWTNKYLQWYNSAWALCGDIVIWVCWIANNVNTYLYPTTGHCSSWVKVDIDKTWTDLTFNWKCIWDLWPDVSCSAKKIVNWWWSSRSSCTKSCWWWTQSRTCTNPAPANWWTNCTWASSRACNTQACCDWTLDSSKDCCAPAPAWLYCWWKLDDGTNVPWNNPAYKWCDHAGTLHCVWESTYWNGKKITCNCK